MEDEKVGGYTAIYEDHYKAVVNGMKNSFDKLNIGANPEWQKSLEVMNMIIHHIAHAIAANKLMSVQIGGLTSILEELNLRLKSLEKEIDKASGTIRNFDCPAPE